MTDIAARRKALGLVPTEPTVPPPDSTASMQVLFARINELQAAETQLRDSLAAANGALQASVATCSAETARANAAEQMLAASRAEFDQCNLALTASLVAQGQSEERTVAAETARSVAEASVAFERARPAPPVAAPVLMAEPVNPPPVPKSWLLEGNDPMGNPRRVRMTPEY